MIAYINDTDIYTLLGLDNLSEEERVSYEDQILSTLINAVLARILEDASISEDRKSQLKEFLQSTDITPDKFDSVMEKFPESDKFIDQEIYILKKELLREMITEVLEIPDISESEKLSIVDLNDSLNNDSAKNDLDIEAIIRLLHKNL